MKKYIFIVIIAIILILGFLFFYQKTEAPNNESADINTENIEDTEDTETTETIVEEEPIVDKSSVTYNGWLHTNGSKLENEKNEVFQLRGVSSHGIEWFFDVINHKNLESLKNVWNTNVFRIAMYTDSNSQGYIFNPQENMDKVFNIIDTAIDLDMYVIVDWHILNDNNPQTHKEEAKVFFNEVSKKYADKPNVLYEICNEPNGNNVTWDRDIKPYAEEIIPIIRNNSENALVLVGTPDWSKKLDKAADNPLDFKNVVYTCHFYSGTHGKELRDTIDYCINKDIPVFVSECGLTDASGNGAVYFDKFNEWIEYLNTNSISWVYWSFCNKDESSAILLPSYVSVSDLESSNNTTDTGLNSTSDGSSENSNTTDYVEQNLDFNDYLSNSGTFIKGVFQSYVK